jgi:hypothetical protein
LDAGTEPEERKRAALDRIRGKRTDEVREHAVFMGAAVANLAEIYRDRQFEVYCVPSLEAGRQILCNVFPARFNAPKVLLVVALGAESGVGLEALRRLVEPLDDLAGADPRTVLVGEAKLSDFRSVQNLLWSHVVDWLPVDTPEVEAVARLDRAWRRSSFRRQLVGMGLVSGAPLHVATHHRTRLQMAKDLRLDRLSEDPMFRAVMGSAEDAVSWDPSTDELYWRLWASMQDSSGRWAEDFDLRPEQLAALKSSGLATPQDRLLFLRFWSALLAECLEGVVDMTQKDLRELEQYIDNVGRDFLRGGDEK